jgi:Zn-finger nucleic acid-binding protein
MNCLNCGTEMTENTVITKKDRISYDLCENCGSLWLDAGELDKMAFQVVGSIEVCEQDKDPLPEQQPLRCPRCKTCNLIKVKFLESDEIFLHQCKECGGFFLDGGELNLIDQDLARTMPVQGKGFSDFVNNVHVPYWFKRVRNRSSEADAGEESPPIKGAELLNDTTDHCPVDGTTLNLYSIAHLKFEGCPKCKGIWLVNDELRKLKNTVQNGSLHWLNDEVDNIGKTSVVATTRACVKCRTTQLLSVVFGHSLVVIDWCPQCHGIWLDGGEFEAISEYLIDESVHLPRKDIERRLVEDAKRVVTGGPESRAAEAGDAGADLEALINATIFDHPALATFLDRIPRLL